MQRIDEATHIDPAPPHGIALIMEDEKLLGIATDGDLRRAILSGKNLDDPIDDIIVKNPLSITAHPRASVMLAELHEKMKEKGASITKFHQILVRDAEGNLVDVVTPFELWRLSDIKIKTVAVVGLGYVGLTLALTLNEMGIKVVGVDVNDEVLKTLERGEPHFYEKGLKALLKKHIHKNLIVKNHFSEHESDIYIICVGTPVDDKGGVNDEYLKTAIQEAARVLKPHDLIILRSTVPIGTCRNTVIPLLEKESGLSAEKDFFVAFAPERTVEGKALEELRTLPQVIGGLNKQSLDECSQLFQMFVSTIVPVDSLEEAEAVKLLNNTFRDVSFAFANEVSRVCDGFGLNAKEVIRAANEGYTRNPIPMPSPGVGGACLVKDPYLYAASATTGGYDAMLPKVARDINESMIEFVCNKVDAFVNEHQIDPATAKLFLAGMAFKGTPETSDIRHSTSVDILDHLKKSYQNITIYDPVTHDEELMTLGVAVCADPAEGCTDADCVLMLNNHPSFRDWDIYSLGQSMHTPGFLFDPWGSFSKEQTNEIEGMTYAGL